MNPKYSIIVPVYNAETALNRCIDSILNQTFTNYELILVNDGSNDSSIDIIKQYSLKDRRIIIIDKKNGGVSSARNMGLKKAIGEYIVFIDSDDFIDPTYLEDFNHSSADMIICGYKPFGHINIKNEPASFYSDNKNCIIKQLDSLFENAYIGAPWSKAIKKSLLEKQPYYFNPRLRYGEDIDLNLRIFSHLKSLEILNKSGYNYYVTSMSKYRLSYDEFKCHADSLLKSFDVFSDTYSNGRQLVSNYLLWAFIDFLKRAKFYIAFKNSVKFAFGGYKYKFIPLKSRFIILSAPFYVLLSSLHKMKS